MTQAWLRFGLPFAFAVSFGGLVGCGGGDSGPHECASGGANGTLAILITGTPGATGKVTAAGQLVTTDTQLTVPPGQYDISADIVAEATTSMMRTAYAPTIDNPSFCVASGAT